MNRVWRYLMQLTAYGIVFVGGWVVGHPSPPAGPVPSATPAPGTADPQADTPGADDDSSSPRDAPATADQVDPPSGEPTERGVVAAAVGFLELTEEAVALSPAEAADLQRSISTEASADRLAGEVEATLAEVATAAPNGLTVDVAPLLASAQEVSDGWEVSIWYVEVIVYGNELAVEQWTTATYTLVWESGEWRMSDLVSKVGPVPVRPAATIASPTMELVTSTAGMDDEGWER